MKKNLLKRLGLIAWLIILPAMPLLSAQNAPVTELRIAADGSTAVLIVKDSIYVDPAVPKGAAMEAYMNGVSGYNIKEGPVYLARTFWLMRQTKTVRHYAKFDPVSKRIEPSPLNIEPSPLNMEYPDKPKLSLVMVTLTIMTLGLVIALLLIFIKRRDNSELLPVYILTNGWLFLVKFFFWCAYLIIIIGAKEPYRSCFFIATFAVIVILVLSRKMLAKTEAGKYQVSSLVNILTAAFVFGVFAGTWVAFVSFLTSFALLLAVSMIIAKIIWQIQGYLIDRSNRLFWERRGIS